jgi:hypothetical protein
VKNQLLVSQAEYHTSDTRVVGTEDMIGICMENLSRDLKCAWWKKTRGDAVFSRFWC